MTIHLITLSALILAVLLVRAAFRKRVPARLIYALWLTVLIKMCIPFSFVEVDMPRVRNAAAQQVTAVQSQVAEQQGTLPSEPIVTPIVLEAAEQPTEQTDIVVYNNTPAAVKEAADFRQALKFIWLVGSAAVLAWFAVSGAVFYKKLCKTRRLYTTAGKTKVYISEGAGAPCLVGLIPSIYITPEACESLSQKFVIAHEYAHLRHGDHIWTFLRVLALASYWWNPLVWAAALVSKQDAELAADEAVAAKLNDTERFAYARTILAAASQKHKYAACFGSAPIKERIIALTKPHKTKVLAAILSVALILAAVGCSFVGSREPIVYGDNVLDIDFETLIENAPNDTIKKMHEYFSSVTPTKKNEYTGMFEGKNLIFLTLEGFSYKTIDKERTPTLYKMANEGFVFTNSYTSLWGGSTATGEYAAMTGNFHQSAKCLGMCDGKNMYFALGNQFSRLGYKTYAFHNYNYSYSSRDISHPSMGYTYLAIGNGLEGLTNGWPRSDYEMAVATLPYYIDSDEPFHVYYMTVSGHANYNWGSNEMCAKHRDIVADMDASENVKAYHACQYEVELMLAELVRALDEAGKLEDTVFVMSADHYPYALTTDELKELYGITASDVYDDFDLLRNSIIIWSACMEEPIIVDKPCSSIDILPTVSNLFGLEYDSRLLMGTDILSDSDPLVILNELFTGPNWCWMNKYGVYNSDTGIFTPAEGFVATEEEISAYVKQMNNVLWAKRKYSPMILEKDYYSYIFD